MSNGSRRQTYPRDGSGRGGHVVSAACVDAYRIRLPSSKKYPHVVLPVPLETRCSAEPSSARMMYCWSHERPSRVDWKISQRPSGLKYASAFSPPYVSWRMLRRCDSPGAEAMCCALWAVGEPTETWREQDAKTAVARSATA